MTTEIKTSERENSHKQLRKMWRRNIITNNYYHITWI